MRRFRIVTLGCKVNQYESQYLREGLLLLGYEEASADDLADLLIVNTCTVTSDADEKSRKAIRHLARLNPTAEIVVMGCYATRAAEEIAALPGVCCVIRDKAELPNFLRSLGLSEPPRGVSGFARRHRAYVKIQDGCRSHCTYCIIPYVRPRLSSRLPGEILDEVGRLVDAGYREIVLTGIHLGHYGVDFPPEIREELAAASQGPQGNSLAYLAEQLIRSRNGFRIRLSSLEAVELTPLLLELMKAFPERICPHLHLPMQSGSNRVLERMGRRWAASQFVERCLAVQEMLPRPALTTDVMVGFPGETEEDFEATCEAVEKIRFAKLHVFRFSPREGTPAAKMSDQVPGQVKRKRAETLIALGEKLRQEYIASLAGWRLQLLVENPSEETPADAWAMADRYVPVLVRGGSKAIGELAWAQVALSPQGQLAAEQFQLDFSAGLAGACNAGDSS
ncbi:MAG: tRNA (N(6)-L-threonylcarbamoyladenosine(37)-C(2))-methylthiotransferase MtaB [Thermoguttaceae bacterium]|nr:tRNA (N(6)-L-threonylcarbamoyladenosine(37)-C(2))-methylthiotransferase MtaB [Thermoguttaceae bacterium]MDW8077989.1 tRNA (N(6)-L-threonylcarbamoyladenosine(37)-C(2))-methylthiotransferase MtaB [Thermoguttaceae bacterium]